MREGKYESKHRRRRRINRTGIVFWFIILALIVTGIVFLVRSCNNTEEPRDTTPETTLSGTQQTKPSDSTNPSTEMSDPTTEPTTETTEATTEPTTETTAPEYNETTGQGVAAVAKSLVGKGFEYGGTGPDTFDTTGLIFYCFSQQNISTPRTLSDQYAYGAAVSKENLQPGDVVFFYMESPGEIEYVGIYVGNDTFVAISSSQNAVVERELNGVYFAERFIGARRYS